MRQQLLFVYGSLLSAEPAHHLLAAAERVGTATSEPGYELRNLGHYPALVPARGQGPVHGEIYRVDDATLSILDAYEEHPYPFCRRTLPLRVGTGVLAYLYVADDARRFPRIQSGRWWDRGDQAARSS